MITADVVIAGAGPAGLTAAVAMASAGIKTALIGGERRASDNRTTALLASSVTALETLGVWGRCRDQAAALRVIRIVDATSRLIRAPEVAFAAREIGLQAFGHNIENRFLIAALEARARDLPELGLIETHAQAVEIDNRGVTITLADGKTVSAQLAVGAEGRNSLCRVAAGIATDRRAYPQTALTFNLAHGRPHNDVSTEFHTETGPFTLVPLPGQRSSLVFVVDPAEVVRLHALGEAALALEVERRSHSILGKVAVEPGCGEFPLAVETARQFGARRVSLVGEAAHVVPPIGAQGLNLGLRDAATISELVVAAHRGGADLGADEITQEYDRLRGADVRARTLAIDLLNRSLISDFVPMHGLRGFGIFLLDHIGPLRRTVMREGVAPLIGQPRLMRGEPL